MSASSPAAERHNREELHDPTAAALERLQRKYDAIRADAYAESQSIKANLNGHKIDRRDQLAVAGELERKAYLAKEIAQDLYELLARHRGLLP